MASTHLELQFYSTTTMTETITKQRIMFVDDESNVLDGLRRMLRPKRKEWEMLFFNQPEDALKELEETVVDVVVSDMRMPSMDGAEFLRRVKEKQPNTVRIILSGQSDEDASARAVSVAHQFAAKPCDPTLLQELIGRVVSLNGQLKSKELKAMVGGLKRLPSTPKIYQELEQALANPEVPLDRIAQIIESDGALAAKVLQAVNSSFFGLRQTMSSVGQSVSYLGVNAIRSIVLSVGALGPLEAKAKRAGVSVEAERLAAVHVATVAKHIATTRTMQESAFTAGLLHRAGRLVLAVNLGKKYAKLLEQAAGDKNALEELEIEEVGVSSAKIGAYLLGLWGLPHIVVEAVALQAHPNIVPHSEFDVLAALHIAIGVSAENDNAVDEDYVTQLGVADKIQEWRNMAEQLATARGAA